jgi:pimeloyl-ACP methyl ester carboxylesterase
MAVNYLTSVPGHEEDGAVAEAFHFLAREAGRRQIYAWEPVFDPVKLEVRASLRPDRHALFDLVAPMSDAPSRDPEAARAIAFALAEAVRRVDPLMDPQPFLDSVGVPTLFAHGRDDRLVPFSETVRLARSIPPSCMRSLTITSLFAHSGGTQGGLGPIGTTREAARFVGLLARIMRLV